MPSEALIQFYTINNCGYYQWGTKNPLFGSLDQALISIKKWTSGKDVTIPDTITFEPEDGSNLNKTYCYDIQKHAQSGDYVLTTWNEVETTEDGQISSLHRNSQVGDATVQRTEVGEEYIPGRPKYFWFLPNHQVMATVQFENRISNGHPELNKYIEEYMARHNSATRSEGPLRRGISFNIDGYMEPRPVELEGAGDKRRGDVYPRYESRPMRTPGQIEFIRENQNEIYKIIRKSNLGVDNIGDSNLTTRETFLSIFGFEPRRQTLDPDRKLKARMEVKHTPSEGELNEMINNFQEEGSSTWDNIGFKLSNDNRIYWIDDTLVKRTIQLDVVRENEDTVVNAGSLLRVLQTSRDNLLGSLPGD